MVLKFNIPNSILISLASIAYCIYIHRIKVITLRKEMKTSIFGTVLLLFFIEHTKSSKRVSTTTERRTGFYMGGTCFYASNDYFGSIGSTDWDRQTFCLSLNGIFYGGLNCFCNPTLNNRVTTFISYTDGCRSDYFQGNYC